MIEYISSKNNVRIKHVNKLKKDSRIRGALGLFVVEGARLCGDALRSGIEITEFYFSLGGSKKYSDITENIIEKAGLSFEISDAVAQNLTDTQHPQGLFCVCRMLDKNLALDKMNNKGFYIALEDIRDPNNLGTILRTAEALGVDGVFLSRGCCDVYNPKVLRGTMGSIFRLPIMVVDHFSALMAELSGRGIQTLASVPAQAHCSITEMERAGGICAVIGNEGSGLTPETIAACTMTVTIPMKGRAESLNAAMAAGIIMWQLISL